MGRTLQADSLLQSNPLHHRLWAHHHQRPADRLREGHGSSEGPRHHQLHLWANHFRLLGRLRDSPDHV